MNLIHSTEWKELYKSSLMTPEEAALLVKSGDTITSPPGPSAAPALVNAIVRRIPEITNITYNAGMAMYMYEFLKPEYDQHFRYNSMFNGPLERMLHKRNHVGFMTGHYSTADVILRNNKSRIVLLNVSPPDDNGWMSLGPCGAFVGRDQIENAETVILQVNKEVPYIHGIKAHVHVSEAKAIVEHDTPLGELPQTAMSDMSETYIRIAEFIVEMIPDGATIQLGLGDIANAVGYLLETKKDLGAHTEMITNSMMNLIKKGVITGSRKTHRPGKVVYGFGFGSNELYRFMDRNIMLEAMPISMVNDPRNIAQNDNMISVNNALMIDLTGQIASESLGHEMYSGTGGQLDFVRGAKMSKGGKSIFAIESTAKTKNGIVSKITPSFPEGTIVTTPRADVQYVVTEYGVADLYNKTIAQRVNSLINIAHPDFREELRDVARKNRLI